MSKVQKSNLLIITCVFLPVLGTLFLRNMPTKLTLALNQYLFILIPCILFMLANKMDIKKTLKLNPLKLSDVFRLIALTLVILPITGVISNIASKIFGSPITDFMNDIVTQFSFPYLFFVIAITPAICEEVIMRGVVLDGYRKFGFKKAIILNGVLFGMLHMNFHQFFYTAFLGIIFATVVWYTKSIFASIIMHLVNNGLSVALSFFLKADQETLKQAEQFSSSSINIVVSVVVLMGSVYLTYYFLSAIKKNNMDKLEENYNVNEDTQLNDDIINMDEDSINYKPHYTSDNLAREYTSDKKVGIINISFVLLVIIFLGLSTLMYFQ
ncbi:CPBP family intramembrane glutamic endopeptidase [Oceanirhabdus sp. W0125-5]|uniref:CPBP family intramembrane glutamic endopeptidase n=1 Tax=Oceanirhabdus sp. W0125-5 TaxID=2999116 RepID=UPI0022F2FB2D|nr:type II CAAX endopeptidase family protein [Oceanirhabdus sp. W0125-5]WBW97873.1 type II CAAX endopeptidase family protein [Oceanirhabdus sp. W0125-5]